jgi:hypothetical protein
MHCASFLDVLLYLLLHMHTMQGNEVEVANYYNGSYSWLWYCG